MLLRDLLFKLFQRLPTVDYGGVSDRPSLQKIQLICEIGINWNSMKEAKKMISLAKRAGATHVKFQAYNGEAIKDYPPDLKERLEERMLTMENAFRLKHHAHEENIIWFATPTSPGEVDFLEHLDVQCYKIRAKDNFQNVDLLNRVLETQKPVFLSSSCLPLDMNLLYVPRITWMYCDQRYPPPIEELQLDKHLVGFKGYSNHVPNIVAPFYAACLGAKAIECHVTLDHSRNDLDRAVSIDFNELHRLASCLEVLEKMLYSKEEYVAQF